MGAAISFILGSVVAFLQWHDGMRRLIRCYDAGTDLQGCGLYYAPSLGAQQVTAACKRTSLEAIKWHDRRLDRPRHGVPERDNDTNFARKA